MKLPKSAKQVFKGIIFDVYQWQQKMYDGSFATFEAFKRPDTAVVIAVEEDKILVLEEEQPDDPNPYLALPGGRVEPSELPEAAAKRELLEETGYASDDWELFIEHEPVSKAQWTVYIYVARDVHYLHEPSMDIGEKITLQKFSLEQFILLSDKSNFFAPELVNVLLRLRLDPKKKEEFRKMIFKK